jgi:cellulose synthase/poly-beta-1,6-N-acetylglucosamine synthase-like glycosyltransferase
MVIHLLLALYGLCVALLTLYALGQAVLLVQYLRLRGRQILPPPPAEWPLVCVQLPIYNEQHVALRLLKAITQFDYPRDKLHVQILDDSTDETPILLGAAAEALRAQGWQIDHLRRSSRAGYKAGALAHGLHHTRAEYVAIFDADFVPPPHFLKAALPPLLADRQVGVIQTAWGHLNADANWLTRAQRLAVDAHFVIEQTARSRSGWILPFNGTGGVWRVAAIHAAGGWSDATLTEDCDLSYRAQLAGWRSLYLPHVVVPGELPTTLAAYQQQQARWAQGNTQCLRRLLPHLLRTPMPLGRRLMALHHLCQYLPQPLMLLSLLLLPPLMLAEASFTFAPLGLISVIPPLFYWVSQQAVADQGWRRLTALPVLIVVGTGLIVQNSLAVLRGLWHDGGVFERTPKFAAAYRKLHARPHAAALRLTALCALYAISAAWIAARHEPWALPYVGLYAVAFGSVSGAQWWQRKRFK